MPRRLAFMALGVAVFVLVAFFVVEALGAPLLVDPFDGLTGDGPAAALLGVGLLVADVLIPVPSSLVMTAFGALYGLFAGALLAWAGGVGATVVGFALGRRGTGFVTRHAGPAERERAERLLARWGVLAVIVTRPLPVLAETVAIVAGASSLTWRQLLVGATVGTSPAAVVYALAGAVAPGLATGVLVPALVFALAGFGWFAARLVERRVDTRAAVAPPRSHGGAVDPSGRPGESHP
ncbi:TVP38/TMEM64 family protein [Streptosporangium carneum]|uniref:VTT domain-containing protein n=1 Tax=Streptosporangium carneum TaxID=47481 RepID=A0A9W6IBY8_9ACTN|nr:VTT domain-containing protein [Streptosporangium carneum]GLK14894.1 hypothetical protein GCM10017600_83070 [Streptosporangium carneum]